MLDTHGAQGYPYPAAEAVVPWREISGLEQAKKVSQESQ